MADQFLPEEELIEFTEDQQQAIIKRLKYHYDAFMGDAAALHKQIDESHRLYEAKPEKEEKSFPWKGAANYVIPLIGSVVDAIHARIAKAVYDVDPLWIAKPRSPSGVVAAKKAQWYLDYWADYMNLTRHLDASIQSMLIEGTSILKIEWARRVHDSPAGQVVEYDAPNVTHVPIKDFIIAPFDSPSIDDAVYVGHRVYLTENQLRERGQQGYYFNVDRLIARAASGDKPSVTNSAVPSHLRQNTGTHSQYGETQKYEIVEMYGDFDYGDGQLVRSVFTFSPRHEILLRLQPYPHQYNRFPYVDFTVMPRPNFFFGRSIPDLLSSFQSEITAMHNMRADSITKRIAPPILRIRGSLYNPEEQYWAPGQLIDVHEMGELMELAMQDVPGSSFAQEQDLMAFVERLTGMSDYHLGRTASSARTATEVNTVKGEGLARLDIKISRFQYGMARLAWHLHWLLYQYRPLMDAFHAAGQDYIIAKSEMRPDVTGMMPYEYVPQGSQSDATKESLRQQNLLMLQIVAPYLQQFYPDGLQYLLEDTLRMFDKQDRGNILGPSWNMLQQQMQQAFQQGMQEGMKQGAQAAAQQGG